MSGLSMPDVPEVRTDRLVLRGLRLEDFAGYAAFYASDRAAHIGGPIGAHAAWKLFSSDVGHWALMGFGWWAVEHDGVHVGQVGLHRPPAHPEPELGWFLFAASEGQGFAREAAEAAREWGFATLGLTSCVSYVAPANHRSIALAERMGAVQDSAATRPDHAPDVLVFRHRRSG